MVAPNHPIHRQVITRERDDLARIECDTCSISTAVRGLSGYGANEAAALAEWRRRHDTNGVPRGLKERY